MIRIDLSLESPNGFILSRTGGIYAPPFRRRLIRRSGSVGTPAPRSCPTQKARNSAAEPQNRKTERC